MRLGGLTRDGADSVSNADDVSARLSFRLAGLDLAPLGAYLPAELPLRLRSGRLDVDLALDFAERPKQPPRVKFSGGVQLHALALTRPDGQQLLELKQLSLPLTDVQPLRRQLGFGQIVVDTPVVALAPFPARRDGAGAAVPWQLSLAGLEAAMRQLSR